MAIDVYFAKEAKKRNSTYRFNLTGASKFTCTLKAPTSLDRPTFLITSKTAYAFDYNLAYFDDRFYFVDDVVSVRDGQWEVSCVMDVLATAKTELLAQEFFVSYSQTNPLENWLADERIPVLKETVITTASADWGEHDVNKPFDKDGFYCLTVTGDNGTVAYAVDKADIEDLLQAVNNWYDTTIGEVVDGSRMGYTYDFTTPENALESMSKILAQSDVLGNAYSNAPACIRSCIWLPLKKSLFIAGSSQHIYLGSFDTGVSAYQLKTKPEKIYTEVSIPWNFAGWERSHESVCLYLPFIGSIGLTSDVFMDYNNITCDFSISAIDGKMSVMVYAGGSNVLGVYTANIASEYAIGINQKASLGEIVQTAFEGASKTVSAVIDTSLSPVSVVAGVVGATMSGIETAYNVKNVQMSSHPTTIGSLGGAGSALLLNMYCICVGHPMVTTQANIAGVLGYPVMKKMSLSGLSGYVQCANAHASLAMDASEVDAVDTLLNSGFYIE